MSEIRRLRMLVELGRRGTLSAVAVAMSYSTSGVSQQLAALERDFGAVLLEPDGRRVRLTPAGQALVRAAPAVLDAWEGARTGTAIAGGRAAGPVRIAMFQTGFLCAAAQIALSLREHHPDVELFVTQAEPEQAVPAMLAREIDLAVIERYPGQSVDTPAGLSETTLRPDAMLLALPAASPPVALAELADRPWVTEAADSQATAWVRAQCRAAGFEPRVVFETSDIVAQCDLVRAGAAVAFVPALTPAPHLAGLRTRQLARTHARTLGVVVRSGTEHHPAFAATHQAVVEALCG